MKKLLSLSVMLITLLSCSKENSEPKNVKTINTEFGQKVVTVNENKNQVITLTKEEWSEVLKNLSKEPFRFIQSSDNVTIVHDDIEPPIDVKIKEYGIKVKFKIGALKYNCKKGIGFRCGGSVGPYAKLEVYSTENSINSSNYTPLIQENGRHIDRIYECFVKEVNGQITIEFLKFVDWQWLEETETN
jgi:hypothetical protein